MKRAETRPHAALEAADRKLVELATGVAPVQDGCIHIEKINAPFLFRLKAKGSDFGAGLEFASSTWLELHDCDYWRKASTCFRVSRQQHR